jgi:hypothetical protein
MAGGKRSQASDHAAIWAHYHIGRLPKTSCHNSDVAKIGPPLSAFVQVTAESAVEEMQELVEGYNRCVQKAMKTVYWKYAFTIDGIALGLAGATLGSPLASASAFLSLAAFWTFDRKPAIDAGQNKPAAIFHDVQRLFGWRETA